MKKLLMAILVTVLSISTVFAITACKKEEALKVTITYDADGGQISQTSQEVDANDFTLLVPTKDGYTFKGWTLNGNAFTKDNLLRNDVTLKAVWEINKFNVTFEVGDRGTLNGNKTQTLNAVGYELPTVNAKVGSEFIGWTLDGQDFAKTTVLTEDITLVAKYETTQYTITYSYIGTLKRNGVIVNSDTELLNKTGYELPSVERDGFTFKGWKIKGTSTVIDETHELAGDYVLEAIMENKTYSVIYFNDEASYNDFFGVENAELVPDTYVEESGNIFGRPYTIKTPEYREGESAVWKGCYVVEGDDTLYDIDELTSGSWSYDGTVYVYPKYSDDYVTVRYQSGLFADIKLGDDYVDYQEDKIKIKEISSVKLKKYTLKHNNDSVFVGWTFQGAHIDSNAKLVETLNANKVKDGTIDLYAKFVDENSADFIRYQYEGVDLVTPIVILAGETYDLNVDGLSEEVNKILTGNAGYHIEWYVNTQKFTSISFANSEDIYDVIVQAKLVKNSATLTLKIWGPEGDMTVGAINGKYSETITIEHGDRISEKVKLSWYKGYEVMCFTDTAWSNNVSEAPVGSPIVKGGIISISENNANITLYIYYYNKTMS